MIFEPNVADLYVTPVSIGVYGVINRITSLSTNFCALVNIALLFAEKLLFQVRVIFPSLLVTLDG